MLALIGIFTAQAQVHPDIVDFQRAHLANAELATVGRELASARHHGFDVAIVARIWAADDRRRRGLSPRRD